MSTTALLGGESSTRSDGKASESDDAADSARPFIRSTHTRRKLQRLLSKHSQRAMMASADSSNRHADDDDDDDDDLEDDELDSLVESDAAMISFSMTDSDPEFGSDVDIDDVEDLNESIRSTAVLPGASPVLGRRNAAPDKDNGASMLSLVIDKATRVRELFRKDFPTRAERTTKLQIIAVSFQTFVMLFSRYTSIDLFIVGWCAMMALLIWAAERRTELMTKLFRRKVKRARGALQQRLRQKWWWPRSAKAATLPASPVAAPQSPTSLGPKKRSVIAKSVKAIRKRVDHAVPAAAAGVRKRANRLRGSNSEDSPPDAAGGNASAKKVAQEECIEN